MSCVIVEDYIDVPASRINQAAVEATERGAGLGWVPALASVSLGEFMLMPSTPSRNGYTVSVSRDPDNTS